jgi:hypothetical protein
VGLVGDAVGVVEDIFGGVQARPRRRRQRAIGGGGGGGGGDDSPPPAPPPALQIEDRGASSGSGAQGPLAILDRPRFLPIADGPMGNPRPKRQPRWMAHVAEGRAWVSRTANGGNSLNPSGTQGWSHGGPT